MARYRLRKTKQKSHIPTRLNILFFVSFLCFGALFIRLGYLQLYNGEYFKNMVQQTETVQSTGTVPRGMMYDSEGKVLVGNHPELAILYTRGSSAEVTTKQMAEVARQLASMIEVEINNLSDQDKKDYFLALNLDLVRKRLSEEDKLLDGAAAYRAQLEAVTSEDINFSQAELKIAAIYKKMNSAYNLSTVTVKNKNVTQDEIARVSEHLDVLKGISVGTDWQRIYPLGDTLRSILGSVSTEQQGLPSERVTELIAKGYSMNDRVGISYLEQQYEDVLKGTKSVYNSVTNNQSNLIDRQLVYNGSAGDNIVLTVDSVFQKKLDVIVEESLKDISSRGLNDRIYVVVTDPNTGEVLGISGKKFKYNSATDSIDYTVIEDDALGAINTSYGMGSAVKPAMVAMGYMSGAISLEQNTLVDEPMKFQASKEKSSVFNRQGRVSVDDITALERSSNIYMVKLAMLMGGQSDTYTENMRLSIAANTITRMRDYFALFGLGVSTGIDLPNESIGFTPSTSQLVSALDLSYGQFDLYTPLQMAQYVATIANGGTRYALNLVKEIRGTNADGTLGAVKATMKSRVLNTVPIDASVISRIQQGMYQVANGSAGTAVTAFGGRYPIRIGAKTGTAEAFYSGPIEYARNEPVQNSTFVAYAPFDNPKVAISVVVPFLPEDSTAISTSVAKDVLTAYFSTQQDFAASVAGQTSPKIEAANQAVIDTTIAVEPETTTQAE